MAYYCIYVTDYGIRDAAAPPVQLQSEGAEGLGCSPTMWRKTKGCFSATMTYYQYLVAVTIYPRCLPKVFTWLSRNANAGGVVFSGIYIISIFCGDFFCPLQNLSKYKTNKKV